MATTSWAATTFCTPADVRQRLASPELPLFLTASDTVDAVIQQKITLSKDWLRQDLLWEFNRREPVKVRTWLQYKNSLLVAQLQSINRSLQLIGQSAGLPNTGVLNIDGAVFDLFYFLQYWPVTKPHFFTTYGPPTSGTAAQGGTYVGSAVRGDMLIDSLNWQVYINQGEAATQNTEVNWNTATVTDFLDNIMNPQELKHVAVDCCVWAMFQDGALRNQANQFDPNIAGFMMDNEKKWEQMYRNRLERIIPLIQIDIDHDGIVSDYERNLVSNEPVLFGA